MTSNDFFELFLQELKDLPELYHYYKFHTDEKRFEFRKSYFLQRLDYLYEQILTYKQTNETPQIWDCGCGYATSCLFLAMNGIASHGTTLEFYFPFIQKRKEYWAKYGNSNLFTASYEDMYENNPASASVDIIIVQDTIHHLEPIEKALQIFNTVLKPNGIVLAIEENGDNIIQRIKLYKQRGNNRIMIVWDEHLQRNIIMGNENIRGIKHWAQLFNVAGFNVDVTKTHYVRYYLPQFYNNRSALEMTNREQAITSNFLKKYFFFGINFIAKKISLKTNL